jgi:5-hydroxyisourate hydrolase
MSGISCHVLDTARGRPARGIAVRLERRAPSPVGSGDWQSVGRGVTNDDGRATGLEGGSGLAMGLHRLVFETEAYLLGAGLPVFYPEVQVTFIVASPSERYHIPLLLSPFGYSTYRGS